MTSLRVQPRFASDSALAVSRAALWVVALSAGCAEDATSGDAVAVLTPSTVSFPWDDAFDLPDDGVAALVPFDVMVYRSSDGLPVARAEVALHAFGAELVSPAAVTVVGGDGQGCPVGGDNESCVWDVFGDALVRLDPTAPPAPDFVGETDGAGLLRVYAVVDAVIDAVIESESDDLRVSAQVLNRGALAGQVSADLDVPNGDASSWTQLVPR